MPDTAFLHIQADGDPTARVIELTVGPIRIGRGAHCEVRLGEPSLADVQCLLKRRGASWQLSPVGPPGPVWVEGQPLDRQRTLEPGMPVRVGDHWLTLHATPSDGSWGSYDMPIPVESPGASVHRIDPTLSAFDAEAVTSRSGRAAEPPRAASQPADPDSLAAEAERLKARQQRLEQRERWMHDRREERKWEARLKATGEQLRARSAAVRPRPSAPARPEPSGPTTYQPPRPGHAPRPEAPARPAAPQARAPQRPAPAAPPAPEPPKSPPDFSAILSLLKAMPLDLPPPVEVPLLPPRSAEAEERYEGAEAPLISATFDEVEALCAEAAKATFLDPEAPASPEMRAAEPPADAVVEVGPAPEPDAEDEVDVQVQVQVERVPELATRAAAPPPPPAAASPPPAQEHVFEIEPDEDQDDEFDLTIRLNPAIVDAPLRTEPVARQEPAVAPEPPPAVATTPDAEPDREPVAGPGPAPIADPEPEPIPTRAATPEPEPAPRLLIPHDFETGTFTTSSHDFYAVPRPAPAPAAMPAAPAYEPEAASDADEAAFDASWPSATTIFASRGERESRVVRRGRVVERGPRPSAVLAPDAWTVPSWLGLTAASLGSLAFIAFGLGLSLLWVQDDQKVRLAERAAGTGFTLPGEAMLSAPGDSERAWYRTTAANLGTWARAVSRSEPGEDREGTVRRILDSARSIAPLDATARFAQSQLNRESGEGNEPERPAAGQSRDPLLMSWSAGKLRAAGKAEPATALFRKALENLVSSPIREAEPTEKIFDDDAQGQRYLLPRETLIRSVLVELTGGGESPISEWEAALPASSLVAVTAARLVREKGATDLSRLLVLAAEAPAPAGGDPSILAEHHAAQGEALAMQSRWLEAEEAYRLAIGAMPDLTSRRRFQYNLAKFLERQGKDAERKALLEEIRVREPGDELTRRIEAGNVIVSPSVRRPRQ